MNISFLKAIKICKLLLFTILLANATNAATVITVHVSNKDLAKKTLTLRITEDYILGSIGSKEYKILSDGSGYYKWKSSSIKTATLFLLRFDDLAFVEKYLEPGDDLHINYIGGATDKYKDNDTWYSGKGSERFKVEKEIFNSVPNNIKNNGDQPFGSNFIVGGFNDLDSIYMFKKRILDSYKNIITSEYYQLLDALLYANLHLGIYTTLISKSKMSVENKQMIRKLYPIIKSNEFKTINDVALKLPSFISYLKYKSIALANIISENSQASFEDVYKEIIKDYLGNVREKVLINFLASGELGEKKNDRSWVYLDAMKYIQKPIYRKLVSDLNTMNKSGTPFYNFNLPDQNGQRFTLKDFKGKIVIIDFWFTGCFSCSLLSKEIEANLIPYVKDRNDIVFLSICVDRSKETWINSIKGGLYTTQNSIKLYTEGKGFYHPMLTFYQFQSYPKLMLIDKDGNMFNPSMPKKGKDMLDVINLVPTKSQYNY